MKILNKITKKPWGQFNDLAENKGVWHLKVLKIKKGHELSLQKHQRRSEFWVVVEGRVQVTKGKKTVTLTAQKSIAIAKKEVHRIKALTNAVVIEISFGLHDENDIIRLADDYGRVAYGFEK